MTNSVSNSVSVIDAATNTVVATVPVGMEPGGVAVNPSGTRVYVANLHSANVSVIDATNNTVTATVVVGASPGGVIVNQEGTRVYIGNSDSNNISIIDPATNMVVTTFAVGGDPEGIAISPDGTRLYVTIDASNSVAVIDTATNAVIGSVVVGTYPGGVALNPAGTRAYVTNAGADSVSVIDIASNAVVATVHVGTTPGGVAVNPGGTDVYVANFDSNNVSVIDAATNTVTATIAVGTAPVALGLFIGPAIAAGSNYQGLWWLPTESGWGINLAHQGDTIFASWFTYDTAGEGWWLVMTALKTAPGVYSGDFYKTSGPRFDAYDKTLFQYTKAGTGTLTFTDANNGTFRYVIGAVDQTKAITRQVFGTLPTCIYGTQHNLALATNYQDLWWAKPGASEDGWGINLNHQSDTIFATWFTYEVDGTPMWLVMSAPKSAPGVYTGDLLRTRGPRFDAYDTSQFKYDKVGTATLTFTDGNTASFHYDITGVGPAEVSQTKTITRQLFSALGTTCQ